MALQSTIAQVPGSTQAPDTTTGTLRKSLRWRCSTQTDSSETSDSSVSEGPHRGCGRGGVTDLAQRHKDSRSAPVATVARCTHQSLVGTDFIPSGRSNGWKTGRRSTSTDNCSNSSTSQSSDSTSGGGTVSDLLPPRRNHIRKRSAVSFPTGHITQEGTAPSMPLSPPSPCPSCGENHWKSDCPRAQCTLCGQAGHSASRHKKPTGCRGQVTHLFPSHSHQVRKRSTASSDSSSEGEDRSIPPLHCHHHLV